MHLSTSNFERKIPAVNWRVILPTIFVVFILIIAGWEIFWRSKGYAPTLNDSKYLWAKTRESIKPDDVVIIGSSRGLFDIDLKSLATALQVKEVKQLAMTGSSPTPVLEALANDPHFKGIIICDVVPGLFFAPAGPPINKPTEWVKNSSNFSPSDRAALEINMVLESYLAYLKQDDLSLKELIKHLDLPNRDNTIIYPKLPPYFCTMDSNREAKMTQRVLDDKEFRELIQNRWPILFTPPPFQDNPTPEVIGQRIEGMIKGKIQFVKGCLEKIQNKGGKIIFVRFPSSGPLKELEAKLSPRVAFWDRMLAETGAQGIYWEDYENLKNFDCPEWSHLSAADSVKFTQEIGPIIKEKLSKKEEFKK